MDSFLQAPAALLSFVGKLNPYILIPICLALYAFANGYMRRYQRPAEGLLLEIQTMLDRMRATRAMPGLPLDEIENRIDHIFETSTFSPLWAEYRQSLRVLHDEETGSKKILATVPAETFFSKEAMIDLRINADFYRHLPGILTGIGIIGTFSGLVWGLLQFRPDTGRALDSLPILMQEVTSAFIGSGLSILCAIFITYKEKSILNACYRLVGALNHEIDSMHALGAGEEYLARLVNNAQGTQAMVRSTKDELLADLSGLVDNAMRRQDEQRRQDNAALTNAITGAIVSALEGPVNRLANAAQQATGSQQQAVGHLLESLLMTFLQKTGDVTRNQIEGMGRALQESSVMIVGAQDAMANAVERISSAGTTAADTMAQQLEGALSRALATQESTARDFTMQQSRFSVETQQAIVDSLERLQVACGALSLLQERQVQEDKRRHDNFLSTIDIMNQRLLGNIEALAEELRIARDDQNKGTALAKEVAITAAHGMQEGAQALQQASVRFAVAGDAVTGLTHAMTEAASDLEIGAVSLKTALQDNARMDTALRAQVASLQSLIEAAKKDAGTSRALVDDIEKAARALSSAEKRSLEHMASMNAALKESFRDFGVEMVRQVRDVNQESNHQLSVSLQALSGTVDSIIASVTKLRRAG